MGHTETPFLGLAPFLRMNIDGADLRPIGQQMLAQAEQYGEDANLWMNLSTVMLCLKQHDLGLAIRAQALELQHIYRIAARVQPAKFRLLLLMTPGDLAANTPLDCLLENSDIDLIYYHVSHSQGLIRPIPEHDALFVAISDSDENRLILDSLAKQLADWPKPVLNAPQYIQTTGRDAASQLLQNAPGLLIPPTFRTTRTALLNIATGASRLADLFAGCDFPIILRPVGSQAGIDLARLGCLEELAGYLARVKGADFFLAPFIDYSGSDHLFRKYRIALIDGVPYACHMGVSSDWMIHYVNAGMYEDAQKRAEEAAFMVHFDDFASRHKAALDAIYLRTGLDYLCIDCAQTREGELLIFEIDHTMVVHAMDPVAQFPYKPFHIQKAQTAFRDFLFRRAAGLPTRINSTT